jgi:phage baseplate assembly protein V
VFRVGIVKSQDVQNARVRVTFPDRNQLTSWWLPVGQRGCQNDKDFWMPDVGEQVVCDMDERDEDGVVLCAIYSSADTPPAGMTSDKRHLTVKDNATFEYDRHTHALAVAIPNGGTVNITANGATIQIDASGNITLHAARNINLITGSHNDSVNGIINTYNGHTHPDPQCGNTSAPTQQMT